jgi:hypothetical protein
MEEISKNLQRYFDNKEKYNERQKKYFREVWYPKNKERLKKEREKNKEKKAQLTLNGKKENKKKIIYINEDKNLSVDLNY